MDKKLVILAGSGFVLCMVALLIFSILSSCISRDPEATIHPVEASLENALTYSTKLDSYAKSLVTESSLDYPRWNIEKKGSGRKASWDYIDGCMINAMLEMYNITGEEKYLVFSDYYVGTRITNTGHIEPFLYDHFNLDNINEGKTLFKLYTLTGKEKYKLAHAELMKQVKNQPRTKEGNFWHKGIYKNQVWLDGLYMVMPYYMEYANTFYGKDSSELTAARNDIYHQFFNVEKIMKDSETGLYYHGYDSEKKMFWADKETGLSENFWLRSLGWFSMAMLDTIIADKNPSDEMKEHLTKTFVALMDSMLVYQCKNGMWYQLPAYDGVHGKELLRGNYLETSGSAIMSYCLLKASRKGMLNIDDATRARFKEAGLKAFNGLCRDRLNEGSKTIHIGGICLTAGLGPDDKPNRDGSTNYYLSEKVVYDDAKGTGPFLLAYTQLLYHSKEQ